MALVRVVGLLGFGFGKGGWLGRVGWVAWGGVRKVTSIVLNEFM